MEKGFRGTAARGYLRAMSEENVEVVRRVFEAYVGGDLEESLKYTDPDVVWNPVEEAPRRGHDAVRSNMERWESDWEDLETTPEEFIDAGDAVLVTVHFAGRGRGSGIEVDARLYEVYRLRDGKIVRMDEFTERSEALEAAGLSE
jgi:ketosteroid isomerase-like protein